MARDYRTLKLEILAETKQFVDDMKKSETQVEGFGGKMEKFGKVAAAAFAAAAAAAVAYAGKLAIDGVKAAIEDEAAQARLAKALQNVTGATNTQIAAVEKQIEKMSLAFGIADDELRPSFQRLATATGDLAKAQSGLQLALDISAATGKSVEAVSNALGKAYEGNTGALGRLGIGLSSAEIKSLGLKGTMDQLAATFGGAATTQANTLEGQINRLKVGFDEAKESVGAALLPAVKAFIDYITNRLIPMLIEAKDRALAPIKKAFEDNKEAIQTLWQFTKDYLVPLFEVTLVRAIENVGKVIGTVLNIIGSVVDGIRSLINQAISAINQLLTFYNQAAAKIPLLTPVGLIGGIGGAATNAGGGERAGGSIPTISSGTNGGFTFGGAGGGGGGGGGAGGGGGVDLAKLSGGLITSPADLIAKLTATSQKLSDIDFALKTGQISKVQASKLLNQTEKEFNKLSQIADALANSQPITNMASAENVRLGNAITINVNAPSVIDEVGFTRAVVDAMNSVERTSAGGYSALFK
jgi:hypothetical protein